MSKIEPFLNNKNVFGHIDYKKALFCNKNDYKTSTGVGLKGLPLISQNFESIPERNAVTPTLRNVGSEVYYETFKSTTKTDHKNFFNAKKPTGTSPSVKQQNIRYLKEKLFKNPPKPNLCQISEMKRQYSRKTIDQPFRTENPPDPFSFCPVEALSGDSAMFDPALPSYVKWLDPYVSTTHMVHTPFSVNRQNDIVTRKNIMTFYDNAGFPKSKGFGPKNPTPCIPPLIPNQVIQDRTVFKKPIYERTLSRGPKSVPNKGMVTEMQSKYIPPSRWPLMSHMYETDIYTVEFPNSSKFQTTVSPSMYNSEYKSIGSGKPIRAAVNPYSVKHSGINGIKEPIIHKPCCIKVDVR